MCAYYFGNFKIIIITLYVMVCYLYVRYASVQILNYILNIINIVNTKVNVVLLQKFSKIFVNETRGSYQKDVHEKENVTAFFSKGKS